LFRLSSGDHHHFVWVRGESEVEVHLPIAPQVEQGTIEVVIELNTQIMSSEQRVEVEILPEGSIVHRHTSALLDLKSRANVLRFMNVIVDETPIIPYEVRFSNYVGPISIIRRNFGSASGSLLRLMTDIVD